MGHLVLAASCVLVQAVATLQGSLGVAAQLSGGVSSPTGAVGYAVSAAEPITALLLLCCLQSGRLVSAALALTIVEALVLSSSGFRGQGVVFLVTVAISLSVVLPRDSVWRSPRRILMLGLIAGLAAVVAFALGTGAKSLAAESIQGQASVFLLSGDSIVQTVFGRLDASQFLEVAARWGHDGDLPWVLSWQSQVSVLVPRPLWPDKPLADYGNQVSIALFGAANGQNSNSITNIGSVFIEFGLVGVAVCGFLWGSVLAFGERWLRPRKGLLPVVLTVGLSTLAVSVETAPILAIASATLSIVLAGFVWVLGSLVSHLVPATR